MALVSVPANTANSESGNSSAWSPVYGGGAKLDSEAINFFHRIYCRECRMEEQRRMEEARRAEAGAEEGAAKPTSPQNTVEEASLQQAMDKNKESLKRRLMLRRSVNELVEQGIYPPLKTPPAFNEERKKLELARNRDILRQKIQQRPNRESLVQQHILEDSTADRSIQDRQRQLKRARLQDSLSDRLAHRPGPLELVEGNILQVDPDIKDRLADGSLQFARTRLDDDGGHFTFDSAGSPSDGESASPLTADSVDSMDTSSGRMPGIPSPPDITPLLQKLKQQGAGFGQLLTPITTESFVPVPSSTAVSSGSAGKGGLSSQNGNSSKLSRIKKPKPKSAPKAKVITKNASKNVIKFHEYKGPPNAAKGVQQGSGASVPSGTETPYHILLQQQQLFLQWQLEFQQKNLQLILPAKQKEGEGAASSTPSGANTPRAQTPLSQAPTPTPPVLTAPSPAPSDGSVSNSNMNPPSVSPQPPPPLPSMPTPPPGFHVRSVTPAAVAKPPTPAPVPAHGMPPMPTPQPPPAPVPAPPARGVGPVVTAVPKMPNFDEMKVADLKAELRKRSLTVSGTKSQLVERLKVAIQKDIDSATAEIASNQPPLVNLAALPEPLKSPPSVTTFTSPQSVAPPQEETCMNTCSPPTSPTPTDLNASFTSATGPTSPENSMDTSQGPLFSIIVSQGAPQGMLKGTMPMAVEHVSRPPSVVPMDVDSSTTDQNQNPQPAGPFITLPLATLQRYHVTSQPKEQVQSQLLSSGTKPAEAPSPRGLVQQQRMPPSGTPQQVKLPTIKVEPNPVPSTQMQVITQTQPDGATEALLRQQQQQIEELQRKLNESQKMLQEAENAKNLKNKKSSSSSKKKSGSKGKGTSTSSNTKANNSATVSKAPVVTGVKVASPVVGVSVSSPAAPVVTTVTTAVASTAAPTMARADVKAVLSSFLQSHGLHSIGQPKVLAVSSGATSQPIIIMPRSASAADTTKVVVTTTAALNGIASPSTRASSVPTSPVNQNHLLHRSTTNPFFKVETTTIPLKEPPKYHEAVKNKQRNSPDGSTTAPRIPVIPVKSQAMDDVLEILIKNGELPPSAAQEPPPTPKTTSQTVTSTKTTASSGSFTAVVPISTFSVPAPPSSSIPGGVSLSSGEVTLSNPSMSLPVLLATTTVLTTATTAPTNTVTTQSIQIPQVAASSPAPAKKEPPPPINIVTSISSSMAEEPPATLELPGFEGLMDMEWNDSDTQLGDLELPDGLETPGLPALGTPSLALSEVKIKNEFNKPSMCTQVMSPQEFSALDLGDIDMADASNGMNLDWLDVIMPNTSLPTPLSSNSGVADPILTPKPQEFLDLFNMEESDLITPTELKSEPMFEALEIETSKS